MGLWVAMHYPPPIGLTEGCWVEADGEEEAAALALEWFDSEDGLPIVGGDERTPVEHFFLIQVDNYVAYRTKRDPVRADEEFQCCAGPIEFTEDGHSGYCPVKRRNRAEVND
jgi:hypothetical protein